MSDYRELLKHPKWQRARLERIEAAGWKCEKCSATEKTLHVHHKQYVRGRMPWEYAHDELEVLCEDCHGAEHGIARRRPFRRLIRQAVRQPHDRVAWMLLLESAWWEQLDQEDREALYSLPGWHGEVFRFLAMHGPAPWAVLRESLAGQPWGEQALALVDGEDPAIEPVIEDLRSSMRQVRTAPMRHACARMLGWQ